MPGAPSSPRRLAFGDESSSDRRFDPGTYILAAALVAEVDVDVVRSGARRLRLAGAKKAHWRDDSNARHDVVVDTIAELPVEGVVVVRRGGVGEREERRRRKCMEHARGTEEVLLWVADALCGAVVAARTGRPRWLERLDGVIVETIDEGRRT
jgi:hypothetical protein